MKAWNCGKCALVVALLSWGILVSSVLLSWHMISVDFAHDVRPRTDTSLMRALSGLVCASYPMSFAAMILAAVALFKKQSPASAFLGGMAALMLFLLCSVGLWMVAHGWG